jgi:hypothetical protein
MHRLLQWLIAFPSWYCGVPRPCGAVTGLESLAGSFAPRSCVLVTNFTRPRVRVDDQHRHVSHVEEGDTFRRVALSMTLRLLFVPPNLAYPPHGRVG